MTISKDIRIVKWNLSFTKRNKAHFVSIDNFNNSLTVSSLCKFDIFDRVDIIKNLINIEYYQNHHSRDKLCKKCLKKIKWTENDLQNYFILLRLRNNGVDMVVEE